MAKMPLQSLRRIRYEIHYYAIYLLTIGYLSYDSIDIQSQLPMVVHVYHSYRQPGGPNHCMPFNGRCSHLCLPAPQINDRSAKISCACPDNFQMLDDELNCVESKFPLEIECCVVL
jgi:hypothetical protein